jgi:hypothetical protein
MLIKSIQIEAIIFDNSQHKKSNQKVWTFSRTRKLFARNKLWRVYGSTWTFRVW